MSADPGADHRQVEAKLRLLRLADELGSVTAACAQTGFSRDSYYRFRRAYAQAGLRGLREMVRSRPRPANRVDAAVEQAVLALRASHPDWGPGRIARDIGQRLGLTVSPSGVRSILARVAGHPRRTTLPLPPEAAPEVAAPRIRSPRSDMARMILNEAFALFAQKNYSSVTMKDIADATGINPSLIHYYFGSKEGLFMQVVEKAATDAYQTFVEISDDEDDPTEIIRLWITNHISQFTLMQNLIKISVDYANTHSSNERIDGAIRKFYAIEAQILNDALQRGIHSGAFREVEIERTATFISTFLDGVLVRSVMFTEFDQAAAIENLVSFIAEHLSGAAPLAVESRAMPGGSRAAGRRS